MSTAGRLVVLCALAGAVTGCPTGRVPAHLQVPDAADDSAPDVVIADLDTLILAMVGRDPLGRTSGRVSVKAAEAVDGGAPYAELLRLSEGLGAGGEDTLRSLRTLEAEHRGTPIVALSRGVRLREIEALVGSQTSLGGGQEAQVLALLTPLSAGDAQDDLPIRPLQWLAPSGPPRPQVLTLGDRWVLTGWLDGPGPELQPVADALGTPPYDALRGTPAARLVLARAGGQDGPTGPGLEDLERAARALLVESVADTKRRREAAASTWASIGEELGSDAPRDALLARAETRLRGTAATDIGAGGALLALQARRIWGDCPDTPCIGVDRVEGMAAAGRWDPRLARLARWLQVAALHEAIDGVDVARGTVRYPAAALELTDALIGNGAVPPDTIVLRQRSPDPRTWLTLGRSVGTEQATTWEEARAALRGFAATQARNAIEGETDPEVRRALERIIAAAPDPS